MTSSPVPTESATTPLFIADIAVRWRDLDAFNHVNNSNYLTYLEEARLQWLSKVPGTWLDKPTIPVVLASEINYRRPITWPARLKVQMYVLRVGNSSITVGHRIVDAVDEATLYSDGQVVMAWMDPATGRSVPLPEAIRQATPAT